MKSGGDTSVSLLKTMKTVDDEDISNSQSVQLPVSINKTLDLSASYLPP